MDNYYTLTVKEIAERLRLSRRTVYRMIADGELPSFKVRGQRRVTQGDFDVYLMNLGAYPEK
jgi:excisionase family DNA binding protein